MDEVMNDLKETIYTVEDYLKYLKETYAQWIKINSVSFRPKYKKKKPIKRINMIKPYHIVITHHKLKPEPMYRKEFFETINSITYKYEFLIYSNGVTKITKYLKLVYADNLGRYEDNYIPIKVFTI